MVTTEMINKDQVADAIISREAYIKTVKHLKGCNVRFTVQESILLSEVELPAILN